MICRSVQERERLRPALALQRRKAHCKSDPQLPRFLVVSSSCSYCGMVVKVRTAVSDPVNVVGPFAEDTNRPRKRWFDDKLLNVLPKSVGVPAIFEIAVYGPPLVG